jgi:arylsulfatase A-like enzyme
LTFLLFVSLGGPPGVFGAGRASHVVVVVWDGMRPDFVTAELTPNLFRLTQDGVVFQKHHPVYLSSTEVNGTAIATGMYPNHSGITGNKEYRPAIDPLKAINTEAIEAVRKGDRQTGNHYLERLTVAEQLQAAGYTTAIAGSKPVALLHDRGERPADSPNVTLFEGKTLPTNILARIVQKQGRFPGTNDSKIEIDRWTSQALIGSLWGEKIPEYSLLWLAEPDFSQHATAPGSARSKEAIKSSDRNLGLILQALEAKGLRDQTDIFVVSDHGFSTISKIIDVAALLREAGFNAARQFKSAPHPDDVVVVGNGGAVSLYVIGHGKATIDRLVKFLQQSDFAGPIFTREKIKGTFGFEAANLDSKWEPDITVSLRWSPATSTNGVPGMVICDVNPTYKGTHATLSNFDLHNTLIAAGPDFRRGLASPIPSGNTDLAPTILWILGVKPAKPMDGRVLTEALTIAGPKVQVQKPLHLQRNTKIGDRTWRQYLDISRVNKVVYFDEGNANLE